MLLLLQIKITISILAIRKVNNPNIVVVDETTIPANKTLLKMLLELIVPKKRKIIRAI